MCRMFKFKSLNEQIKKLMYFCGRDRFSMLQILEVNVAVLESNVAKQYCLSVPNECFIISIKTQYSYYIC